MKPVDNIRDELHERRRNGDPIFGAEARRAVLEMDWDEWRRYVDSLLDPEDVVDDVTN